MSVSELKIQQIVLESVDFRHTDDVLSGEPKEATPVGTAMEIEVIEGGESQAAVRLRIACEAPESPYQYHASYLVFFAYEGEKPEDFGKRLAVTGASMALPFIRELVANLTSRGKFGPTWVGPVNFNKAVEAVHSANQEP